MSNGSCSHAEGALKELYEKALGFIKDRADAMHSEMQGLRAELSAVRKAKVQAEKREQALKEENTAEKHRHAWEVDALKATLLELRSKLDQQRQAQVAPLATSTAAMEWQYLGSYDDEWISMPTSVSEALLKHYEAYTKGSSTRTLETTRRLSVLRLKSGVEEYEFDFAEMLQNNTRTGQQRKIRCKLCVPSHWTRFVDLENLFRASEPDVMDFFGFKGKLCHLNGVFIESICDECDELPMWWRSDGRAVMFVADGMFILKTIDSSYPGLQSPQEAQELAGDAELFYEAVNCRVGLGIDSRPFCQIFSHAKKRWVLISGVDASPRDAAGLSSFMDLAVEVQEPQLLADIRAFLLKSITHEDAHFQASECDSCKDGLSIVRALRIENWRLWTKYRSHKDHMKLDLAKCGIQVHPVTATCSSSWLWVAALGGLDDEVAESFLFHGTSCETAVTIAQEGFDFRLGGPGYYGRGTYFASQACKSNQYGANRNRESVPRCIILSRVALGSVARATKVDRECTRPPLHPGTTRCCDTVHAQPGPMPGHHHGQQTHHEFVVFEKFQAYPEMIIEYYLPSDH
eukprot:TRINITY_DN24107_c0_g1_i2.p1 TRINITY_DN24107_c0_g1~~TRINITY_DN24107_c0_g1_i2.p1  ORF type:complete len:574 (+),score=63.88 TRINITY_DN24107_c0_g1_i2:74-1795(+)